MQPTTLKLKYQIKTQKLILYGVSLKIKNKRVSILNFTLIFKFIRIRRCRQQELFNIYLTIEMARTELITSAHQGSLYRGIGRITLQNVTFLFVT